MRKYQLLEKTDQHGTKIHAIQFNESPYKGMIFSYGGIKLEEDEVYDELHVKFEYEIHQQPEEEYDQEVLEAYLGDFLVYLIGKQLEEQSLVYAGGSDEGFTLIRH